MAPPSSVEAYLAALPEPRRAQLEALRQTIRSAAPEATETISYQMPAFRDGDRILVYYGAFRDHYSLFPASMAVIGAHGDEVAAYHNGKGTLQFRWDQPLPEAVVRSIVAARLEENATRRRR